MSDQYRSFTVFVASSYGYNNNNPFRQSNQSRIGYQLSPSFASNSQSKNRAYPSQYSNTGYQQRSQPAFGNAGGYQLYRFQQLPAQQFSGQRQITGGSTGGQQQQQQSPSSDQRNAYGSSNARNSQNQNPNFFRPGDYQQQGGFGQQRPPY